MPRANQAQLNVRSAFARARVDELTKRTGMTAKQIIEDALRGYVPPTTEADRLGMLRKGRILVLPGKGKPITLAETNAAIEASRNRDLHE